MNSNIHLQRVNIEAYSVIQNLGRFYAYDISRFCGFISEDWNFPENGLYEILNAQKYFTEPDRAAYIVRVHDELAGFVLLHKSCINPKINMSIGEFFIIAKFQGKGVAARVATEIWNLYPSSWEVAVIPENIPAIKFWTKSIGIYTNGHYVCEVKKVNYDKHQKNRIVFEFQSVT